MATREMTQGKPLGLLLTFALPLMLGSVFQQMYTMVDAAVVGQVIGVHALAAVGAAEWINWLAMGAMFGFTQGFSILTAQRFGAGDLPGVRGSVAASIRLTAVIGLLLTVAGVLGIRPMFRLLHTPEDIVDEAYSYLLVCVLGILFIGGYNLFAAILRALGDSRTPLVAMILASCLNIALDLTFVLVLRWGVTGAAVATVTSQTFSCFFCLWRLMSQPRFRLRKEDWRREPALTGRLLRLGVPMAAQNAIISVGGLALQRVINGFGSTFLAGYTAANKLYGLLEMAAISYGYAITTYCGQNLGAKKHRRIRRGVRAGLLLSVVTALCISAVLFLAGRQLIGLFLSSDDPAVAAEALRVGFRFLCYMATFLLILYVLYVYRSALQGMGDTVVPMISGFVELVMRVGAAIVLPAFLGEDGVFVADILAWTGAALLLGSTYYYRLKRLAPTEE